MKSKQEPPVNSRGGGNPVSKRICIVQAATARGPQVHYPDRDRPSRRVSGSQP